MTTVAERVHRNMVEAFASLPRHQPGGYVRRAEGIVVAVTGSPVALFNTVLTVGAGVGPAALVASVDEVRDAGLGLYVQLRQGVDDGLVPVVQSLGLTEDFDGSWPAMVLTDLSPPLEPPEGLDVRRVVDESGFEDHLRASGSEPATDRTWLGPGVLEDPAWTLLVGHADGRPVARSMAFVHDHTVGVYNVGTLPVARRQGYGWAMTAAAIAAGARSGCRVATLQSSAMGLAMYHAHGFRTLYGYRAFHGAAA